MGRPKYDFPHRFANAFGVRVFLLCVTGKKKQLRVVRVETSISKSLAAAAATTAATSSTDDGGVRLSFVTKSSPR